MPGRIVAHAAAQEDGYRGPDAGLAQIGAQLAAGAGAAAQAPPTGGPRLESRRAGPEDVWPLDLSPQQIGAAGATIDPVDWGPPTGRAWHIEEVTITLQGASTVSIYREAVQPVQLRFQTNASGVWEPRRLILLPGKRLLAVAAGGGAVLAIEGVQIALDWLPEYIA